MTVLSDDERLVMTAVCDLQRESGPPSARQVADCVSCWPGARRFGERRASLTLGQLVERGMLLRRRPRGSVFVYEFLRLPTPEERG